MPKNFYEESFYKAQAEKSFHSANIVCRIFKDRVFAPQSVIDVGCGIGTWLAAWKKLGVKTARGIDGNLMPEKSLYIPRNDIEILDLEKIKKLDKVKYDLAMSLEVGEHISDRGADGFVKFLTDSADIVMFSAAIPDQGGTNHINCQPFSYWAEKFAKFGFECFDIMRPIFLQNADDVADVDFWYLQNMLVFATGKRAKMLKDKGFNAVKNPVTTYYDKLIKYNKRKTFWRKRFYRITGW